MARAIALSLTEGDKSSNKTSKKNDSTEFKEAPPKSTADPPPGLKKKRSGNPNEPQDSKSLAPAPNPPPGFKKKQSNNYEADFPVTIKPLESLPSVPSISYGNLIGSDDVNVRDFPTLCNVPTADDKKVAPPPGFEKKTPNTAVVKPEPEKKEPFVKRLKHILGNDENFEEFKTWSSKYRRSEISAEDYESNCYKLFGDQWNDVFDELVATFPDKQGQDDLIKAHQNRVTQPTKKSKAKKHNNYRPLTAWGPGNTVGNRMDDDLYPPLSDTALVQPPPAKWGHKVAVK